MNVICRLVGGLGNQLFIYAAARRLAIVNNGNVVVDNISGFERDFEYQRRYQLEHFNINARLASAHERFEPFSRIRRSLKKRLNRLFPYKFRTYLTQEHDEYDPRLLLIRRNKNIWIEGYWQSERYFKDVEATIRADLRIVPPCDTENIQMGKRIRASNSVAVHVRFFDHQDQSSGNNIESDYYHRAITIIEDKFPDTHYFIFSDQPDVALRRINFPQKRFTIVDHNIGDDMAYADLWLMSLCQHFIIANSTFSWWGAWLSENKNKCIIAPAIRITHGKMAWGFDGLLPDQWIKL